MRDREEQRDGVNKEYIYIVINKKYKLIYNTI